MCWLLEHGRHNCSTDIRSRLTDSQSFWSLVVARDSTMERNITRNQRKNHNNGDTSHTSQSKGSTWTSWLMCRDSKRHHEYQVVLAYLAMSIAAILGMWRGPCDVGLSASAHVQLVLIGFAKGMRDTRRACR